MIPFNQSKSLRDRVEDVPVSKDSREAIEHFERTGSYRIGDVVKVLGDPSRAVEVGPGTAPPWAPSVEKTGD